MISEQHWRRCFCIDCLSTEEIDKEFDMNQPNKEKDIAQRTAGLHYEHPDAVALMAGADWDSYYPEVDGDGYLTGYIVDCTSSDADSYINVNEDVYVRRDALSQEQLLDVDEGRMGGIADVLQI